MKFLTPKIRKILLIAGILIGAAAIGIFTYFRWEQAPELAEESTPAPTVYTTAKPEATEAPLEEKAIETTRQDGIYTILLVGIDDWSDQTDTIIVGKLDTNEHTMNFVSIPRDTLVNVPWDTKKINGVFYGAERGEDGSCQKGIDALKEQVKGIVGFEVDSYAFISIKSFVDVIDAMGGVDFDVPCYIQYIDQTNNYWVFLGPGYQHLDGVSAMGVVRFRETYLTGDLGRIEVQHDFLKAVAEQCLSIGNIPNIKEIISIIESETETDLTNANVAFLLRQALMCKSEDIKFMTVPCSNQFLNELSYAVISLDDWMAMLNEYINPFTEPMTYGNVNIVFKNYFGYGCTGGFTDPAFFAMLMNTPAPDAGSSSEKNTQPKQEQSGEPDAPDIPDEPEQPQEPVVPDVPSEPEPQPAADIPTENENPPES